MILRAALALLLVGCGAGLRSTDASRELLLARQAYQRTEWGPTPAIDPGSLREVKGALEAAERANAEGSPDARDLAYIAARRAEIVEARTGLVLARQRRLQAEKDVANLAKEAAP